MPSPPLTSTSPLTPKLCPRLMHLNEAPPLPPAPPAEWVSTDEPLKKSSSHIELWPVDPDVPIIESGIPVIVFVAASNAMLKFGTVVTAPSTVYPAMLL